MKTMSIMLCMALVTELMIGSLLFHHQQEASAQ